MLSLSDVRLSAQLTVRSAASRALAVSGDRLARLDNRPWKSNPYPIYAELQAGGPWYSSRTGMVGVHGHRLCDEILRDRRFSAEAPGRAAIYGSAISFLELDPPEHTRLRGLARPAFGARKIGRYRVAVERITTNLLDRATARGTFDLIGDFAQPLPIAVITDLLGIPDVDAEAFARYGRVLGASLDGVHSRRQGREIAAAIAELDALFSRLMAIRTAEPGDDVISSLVAAHAEDALTAAELRATCRLLLIAGFETTVNLIGNAVHALLRHPEQWKRLCAEPELAEQAIEETLRYDPPVQMTARFTKEHFEFEGRELAKNAIVLILLGATGRDNTVFARPDEFDITRTPETGHLAFSSGIHYCLGAPLARMEATVALRALAERAPELHTAGTARRRSTVTLRGLRTFPVHADIRGRRMP